MRGFFVALLIAAVVAFFGVYAFSDLWRWRIFWPLFAGLAVVLIVCWLYMSRNSSSYSNSRPRGSAGQQTKSTTSKGPTWWPLIPTYDDQAASSNTSHGSARWLTHAEKQKLSSNGKGLWIGGGMFNNQEGNLCTIAQPGSGKGAALILPNLLLPHRFKHSSVVLDPKGTNAAVSARHQKAMGHRVLILDPDGLQKQLRATHGIDGCRFNPLDWIGSDKVAGCASLAALMLPDDPRAQKFWNSQARDLLQGLLLHVLTSPDFDKRRHLVALYDFVKQNPWAKILELMGTNPAADAGPVNDTAKKFTQLHQGGGTTFQNIAASLDEATDWLKYPGLQATLTQSDFDPNNFDGGGRTLYICVDFDNLATYSIWMRLLIGTLIRCNVKPKSYRRNWVYYYLDEFPTLGVFPEIRKALAYTREYQMRLWVFSQSLAAIDLLYGHDGRQAMLGNFGVFQCFNANDEPTLNYVSNRLGKTTTTYTQTSRNRSDTSPKGEKNLFGQTIYTQPGSVTDSENESEQRVSRPLLYPDEVSKERHIITFSHSVNYKLSKWQYWERWEDLTQAPAQAHYHRMIHPNADQNRNYA